MNPTIETIPQLKSAIKTAARVFVNPRWATEDRVVRISKRDAHYMVTGVEHTLTADEIGHTALAYWDERDLIIDLL